MPSLPAHCAPCERGTPPLDPAAARELALQLPEWELDHGRLRRRFGLKDFRAALAWVNRVGMLAEQEGHHPDFHLTGWNGVELVLWTHTVDGLSLNDFVLARAIDQLWLRRER